MAFFKKQGGGVGVNLAMMQFLKKFFQPDSRHKKGRNHSPKKKRYLDKSRERFVLSGRRERKAERETEA